MSEERLTEIEVKLAHQDQLLIDLDNVVTQQQAKIMQLEALCEKLIERVSSMAEGATDSPHDDAPPHY
jgi:SlyX protein